MKLAETSKAQESKLKDTTKSDQQAIQELFSINIMNIEDSGLDPKVHAISRISALVAMDASLASYAAQVAFALKNGVTVDDIIGVLIALAPTVGMARIVAAAPKLATVLDIEIRPEELGQKAA